MVIAAGAIDGAPVLVAAQDGRFLGGSVGAGHAAALHTLFLHACEVRPAAVVLLCVSGGVRLHEANPAEAGLARALAALLRVRAAEIPVVALAVGDVFGGASVLACAADRIGMLPHARLGLSGPKVIATARGNAEIDPGNPALVDALFGAQARLARGQVDVVVDERSAVRGWLRVSCAARRPFVEAVQTTHAALADALVGTPVAAQDSRWQLPPAWSNAVEAVAPAAGVWRLRGRPVWIAGAPGEHALGPRRIHALDTALLGAVLPAAAPVGGTLVLVEDSPGHEVSRAAEGVGISRFLAHHAAVLARLKQGGIRVGALLAGQGNGAAFFSNALQADRLHALQSARVMAMNPQAVARVTGLDAGALAACIDHDPVLGQPIEAFANWGAVAAIVREVDLAALGALVDALA